MKRIICLLLLVLGATTAWADDPPAPTKDDLDAAKAAFQEGNTLYKAGKFGDAVVKLRESYRLSRNAVLLYNIGFIQEQAGQEPEALFYYRKFLTDAPAAAPMRNEARDRVAALEREGVVASADPDAPVATPPPAPVKKIQIEHQLVDSAPPGLPLDLAAIVPEDPGLALTLYYRISGEATFTKLSMFPRNKQLVARIPAARVTGTQVQYFLELKDASGTLVTRMGRGTAPNLILLDTKAKPHFDATMADDGTDAPPQLPPPVPLPQPKPIIPDKPVAPEADPNRFRTVKWISTGVAGALIGTSLVSLTIAYVQHGKIVDDSRSCGSPPCRQFDAAHAGEIESIGTRYDAIYKVTLAIGVGAAGVAGYFWYRDIKARRAGEQRSVAVTPALGADFAGIAAAGSF